MTVATIPSNGREYQREAIPNLKLYERATELRQAGVNRVQVIEDLTKLNRDLDYGLSENEVRQVLWTVNQMAPLPGPARDFQLRTSKEIKQAVAPEFLIENLFPVGSFVVLYGPPASYKSFIALDWASSIHAGMRWCAGDREAKKGTAVYIAAEGSDCGLKARLAAWERGHGTKLDDLLFLSPAPQFLNGDTDGVLYTIERGIQGAENPPSLIVVDTMARCLVGGDENSSKDVGMFIAAVDEIRLAFGCAVLIVHHSGKGKASLERGSSALRGAADCMISTSEPDQNIVELKCEKQKDSERFTPFHVQLESVSLPGGGSSCYLIQGAKPSSQGSSRVQIWHTVHKEFTSSQGSQTEGVPTIRVVALTGLHRNTVDKYLSQLKTEGSLENVGHPGLCAWRPTEKGINRYAEFTL